MKFKQIVFLLILIVFVAAYATKPTKDEFIAYIQPSLATKGAAPVIDYQDHFLYAEIVATYIYINKPTPGEKDNIATGNQERYIGVFKKFWRLGS